MRTRTATWLAWSLWTLSMALLALGLLLSSWNTTLPLQSVFAALAHPAFATVGALIAARRPAHPIGWLFCASALRVIHSLLPLLFGAMIAAAVSMVLRFRRAQGEERQQLKWVAYAAALMISGLGVVYLITHSVNSPAVELSADVLAALLFAAF